MRSASTTMNGDATIIPAVNSMCQGIKRTESSVNNTNGDASGRRIQRRTTRHYYSPRVIVCWAVILLIIALTTSTAAASTLPFGRVKTSSKVSRGQEQKSNEKNENASSSITSSSPSFSSNSCILIKTRAGSTATVTSAASFVAPNASMGLEPLSYYLRVALAGGVAGATGSALLYPIDSAKTLRQSNPNAYSSVKDALMKMLQSKHSLQRVYRGIIPAAVGAIPSSALYFGAYESSKVALQRLIVKDDDDDYRKRLFVHGLAAASGNIISSFVFVPKEVIKQQLQMKSNEAAAAGKITISSIIRKKGLSGLYAGYGATLLRNIPSATIRFILYEELKRKWASNTDDADYDDDSSFSNDDHTSRRRQQQQLRAAGTFLAGAVAGSTSSFVMTPIDVVKTRMATGSCPLGVKSCMLHVIQEVGYKGLYAGAGSRVLWSGAFSAIGFGTFELVKGYLGVSTTTATTTSSTPTATATAKVPNDRRRRKR